jgi:GMP synthase PP-ATPase subunit
VVIRGASAARITTKVKGVNCVLHDITSKPPGTIKSDIGPNFESYFNNLG